MEGTGITGILAVATEVLTWVITSCGSVITFLIGEPITLLFLVLGLIVMVIGMTRRFVRGR